MQPALGIPYELIIMVLGYIIYTPLVILFFILLNRKYPKDVMKIIIFALVSLIACLFLGYFLGWECYYRSVGGQICVQRINEGVIFFGILSNLSLITVLVGLAVTAYFFKVENKIDSIHSL